MIRSAIIEKERSENNFFPYSTKINNILCSNESLILEKQNGRLVNIRGPNGQSTTLLCVKFCAYCILPKIWNRRHCNLILPGRHRIAVYLDSDFKLSLELLRNVIYDIVIQSIMNGKYENVPDKIEIQRFIDECISDRFLHQQINDSMDLRSKLESLSSSLSSRRNNLDQVLGLCVLDSFSGLQLESHKDEIGRAMQCIQNFMKVYSCFFICCTWSHEKDFDVPEKCMPLPVELMADCLLNLSIYREPTLQFPAGLTIENAERQNPYRITAQRKNAAKVLLHVPSSSNKSSASCDQEIRIVTKLCKL